MKKNIYYYFKTLISFFIFSFKLSFNASKKYMIIRIMIEILLAVTGLLNIVATKFVLDTIISLSINESNYYSVVIQVIFVVGVSVTIAISTQLFSKIQMYITGVHDDIISNKVSVTIAEKSSELDLQYYDNPEYYDIIMNAQKSTAALNNLCWSMMTLIRCGVQLFITLSVIVSVNFWWGIMFILLSIPSSLADIELKKSLYLWQRKNLSVERQMGYLIFFLGDRRSAKDIRFYDLKEYIVNKYLCIWNSWFSKKRSLTFKKSCVSAGLSLLPDIALGIVIVIICLQVINNNMTVGDYSMYTGFIMSLISAIFMLSIELSKINENFLRIQSFEKFMSLQSSIKSENCIEIENINTIEFKNVSFKYPQTDRFILKKLSFCLDMQMKTAIVGLNGAGKSTIIKLLLRYYDPTEGEIYINGIPLYQLDLKKYRKNFGIMFQDFQTYAFTLKENIFISDIERKDDIDFVKHSLRLSELGYLENKIDRSITRQFDEEGFELSGGEYQKISLARAFFREG